MTKLEALKYLTEEELTAYLKNIIAYWPTTRRIGEFFCESCPMLPDKTSGQAHNIASVISGAFNWMYTDEGSAYWSSIHDTYNYRTYAPPANTSHLSSVDVALECMSPHEIGAWVKEVYMHHNRYTMSGILPFRLYQMDNKEDWRGCISSVFHIDEAERGADYWSEMMLRIHLYQLMYEDTQWAAK